MPDLPSLTLSQAHFDRVVAAFPGADNTAKTASYRAWLTNQLIGFVRTAESERLTNQFELDRQAALLALEATLPPPVVYPPR